MTTLRSITRRLTPIAAALSLVGAAHHAQAAVIVEFDPSFPFIGTGAPTNNLGFRGNLTLDLSAGCVGASGYVSTPSSGCAITPTAATIYFYNSTLHPAPTPADYLATKNLGAGDFPSTYVYGAYFDPGTGNLLAFDTFFSNDIFVSVVDTSASNPPSPAPSPQIHYNEGAPPFTDHLNLYFESGYQPYYCQFECGYPAGVSSFAFVAPAAAVGPTGTINPHGYLQNTQANGTVVRSNPSTVVITAIPEPESAALALIGLGALAASRRRKSTTTEQPTRAIDPPR